MSKKLLFKNKWVSVYDKNGYTYAHEPSCNGNKVAVLPWRFTPLGKPEFLVHFEQTPAWGGAFYMNSITGGVDEREDPIDAAVRELKEESGFDITGIGERIDSLGTVHAYKAADTLYHLFVANLVNVPDGEPEGDGSELESSAFCSWVSGESILERSPDSILLTLYLKALPDFMKFH